MATQQLAAPASQVAVSPAQAETSSDQDFGSNFAAVGEVAAPGGEPGAVAPVDEADREKLLAVARIKLSTLGQLQCEGVHRFERDSLLQDPPPYVDEAMQTFLTSALELSFATVAELVSPESAVAKEVAKVVVGELMHWAEGYVPSVAAPLSGSITADVLEAMIDSWTDGTIRGWSDASCEFEMQQSALSAEDMQSLLTALDAACAQAANASYAACLGGWVQYCGMARGMGDGSGKFDPSFLAVVQVSMDTAAPPYFASLLSLPAVGTELPEEMKAYTLRDLGIRAELTNPAGLDLVLGNGGEVVEQKSSTRGDEFLSCIGTGQYDAWTPIPGATGPTPYTPDGAAAGAQILSEAIRGRTLAQIEAGTGWN